MLKLKAHIFCANLRVYITGGLQAFWKSIVAGQFAMQILAIINLFILFDCGVGINDTITVIKIIL